MTAGPADRPVSLRTVLVVVCFAAVALGGVALVGAGDAGAADSGMGVETAATTSVDDPDTIRQENALSLSETPGEVGVVATFTIPDRVTELTVTLRSAGDEPVEVDGFEHAGDDTYEWDETTASPSLSYGMPVNETTEGDGPLAGEGSYRFVDAGDWALVRPPRTDVTGSYVGPGQVRIEREHVVDGEGAASDAMAFLGPHEVHEREVDGEQFRLIVPEAADLDPTPDEIFDAFTHASEALPVGARNPETFAVAAPTGEVGWAARGIQTGGASLWVRDDEPVADADDVWTHEYVHTRQGYRAEASARWFTEATATYYAALFALDRGDADYEEFERVLARGERDPDASTVLADPDTWGDAPADYTKGALVAGEVDRQIRLATDGRASLTTVFRELNAAPDPITADTFLDAVESAVHDADGGSEASAEVRALAERYTATEDAPTTWDRDAHEAAFGGTPARVGYGLADDGVRATGEYRDRPVERNPVTLVTGESLALDVAVRNTGGDAGTYTLELVVDGETVETRTGEIEGGAEATETFEHGFDEPGEHEVRVAGETVDVTVTEPAGVSVTDLSVDATELAVGDEVTATATVRNDAPIPADEPVTLTVAGERLSEERVALDAGDETTVTFTVPLETSGEVELVAGGSEGEASVTLSVADEGLFNGGTDGATDDDTPGFGVGVALAGLVATLAMFGYSAARPSSRSDDGV